MIFIAFVKKLVLTYGQTVVLVKRAPIISNTGADLDEW